MKWDLTKYYKTYEEFKRNLNEANELVQKFKDYKGKKPENFSIGDITE